MKIEVMIEPLLRVVVSVPVVILLVVPLLGLLVVVRVVMWEVVPLLLLMVVDLADDVVVVVTVRWLVEDKVVELDAEDED